MTIRVPSSNGLHNLNIWCQIYHSVWEKVSKICTLIYNTKVCSDFNVLKYVQAEVQQYIAFQNLSEMCLSVFSEYPCFIRSEMLMTSL